MKLPSDITGLVYSYAYYAQPAQWVKKEDKTIIGNINKINNLIILSNPRAVDWILHNINFPMDYMEDITDYIARNKTSRVFELLDKIMPQDVKYSTRILRALAANPRGYQYVLNKYGTYDNIILKCITTFPIPKLIEKYNKPSLRPSYPLTVRDINCFGPTIDALARNPYTFDIFLEILGDAPISSTHLLSISKNTSELAIKYIIENFDKFVPHMRTILANPSAYPIIEDLASNHKIICNKYPGTEFDELDFLSMNPNPKVIELLKKYPEYIRSSISGNSTDEAVDIILENPKLINYRLLSSNTNPRILPLLKANRTRLDLNFLYENPLIFPQRIFTSRFIKRIEDNLISRQKELIELAKVELEREIQVAHALDSML